MKVVVLLSGGIDSSTTCAIAKKQGHDIYALTILYGQKHTREVESAKKVADFLKVKEHSIIELPTLRGSSLTGEGEIPQGDVSRESIPSTFVPARNFIFLGLAANYAISVGAKDIYIGANSVDFSGYPDCRPEFVKSCEETLQKALELPIRIWAPLMLVTKAEIIRLGVNLGLDYSLTTSCYRGKEKACGQCDACLLRLKGFEEAGLVDPIRYVEGRD